MFMSLFYGVLAALVLLAGWLYRRRLGARHGERSGLSDEMIRRIEESGRLELEAEEPLDLDEIRDEESRFWEETWDEPEEL